MRALTLSLVILILTSLISAQSPPKAPGDLTGVFIVDGSQLIPLKYDVASRRSHTGLASGKQYFVFGGRRAATRITNRIPSFEFETDAVFDDPIYLFKFDTRSGTREIRVAKGVGNLAELSIPKDHIVQTSLEMVGDGANATRHYRLKPSSPLRPGEYCLGRNSYTCFDFGVD
jgi:hypothetical protein